MRAGLSFLDMEDLSRTLAVRASEMKTIPRFLWGSFRIALKLALEEVAAGSLANDHYPSKDSPLPTAGSLGQKKIVGSFREVCSRAVGRPSRDSDICSEQAAVVSHRRGRRQESGLDKRVSRVHHLVQLGELSSGREALEGAALAPGTTERPPRPREAIPEIPPHKLFELDEVSFSRNLRSAKKGAASGLSGMTGTSTSPLHPETPTFSAVWRVSSLEVKSHR